MGSFLVYLIIGFCFFYVARKIYLSFKNNDTTTDCGGGCSGCSGGCDCGPDEFYSSHDDE